MVTTSVCGFILVFKANRGACGEQVEILFDF